MESIYIKIIVGVVLGFIFKIVWDWLNNKGNIQKGVYVEAEHCEDIRKDCCLPALKKEVGVLNSKSDAHEKRLDEGREDFALLRKDILLLALKFEKQSVKLDMVLEGMK